MCSSGHNLGISESACGSDQVRSPALGIKYLVRNPVRRTFPSSNRERPHGLTDFEWCWKVLVIMGKTQRNTCSVGLWWVSVVLIITSCAATSTPPQSEPVPETTQPREPTVTVGPVTTALDPPPIGWGTAARQLGDGTFTCPPGGDASRFVWGTDIYTNDS